MDLAGDEEREAAHARAARRVARKQRRLGMRLVQVFDDRERLGQFEPVGKQSRQKALRVFAGVFRLSVLAFGEMNEHGLVGEAFQIERNADTKRGGAAKVRVQLHNGGRIFTLSSPTPSIPACNSSPGLTGPTPAGVPA